ncbi:MAG: hypothetical protein ABFS45_00410 [Pseudomonadota bacterium]
MKTFSTSRKSVLALFLRLWFVMVLMLGIGSVSICNAEGFDCNQLSRKDFESYDKESIKEIQKRLRLIGYNPIEIDGFVGRHAIASLKNFCQDFEIRSTNNFADDLAESIHYYAAIAENYPGWQKIVSSEEFKKWVDKQPADRRIHIRKIIRSGTALLVTSLLEDVNNHADAPAIQDSVSSAADDQPSQPNSNDESGVFFKLTEQDLSALKITSNILESLQALKDIEYSSKKELQSEVQAEVEQVTDQYQEFLPIIVQESQGRTSYRLTEQSFNKLRVENIPDSVIEALQDLNGLNYPSREKLENAVQTKIKGVTEQFQKYLPNIIQETEERTSYTLTETSFEAVSANAGFIVIPDTVLEQLKALQGIEYANAHLFEKALDKVLEGEAPQYLQYSSLLVKQAQKGSFKELRNIRWSGGSCGCVRDFSGIVYGFYPFWMAAENANDEVIEQKDDEQELDFSILTRVGYFALALDEHGKITETRHWNNKKLGGNFRSEAQKHRTKVDVVIYTNKWHDWSESVIDTATTQVVQKLKPERSDKNFTWLQSFFSMLSGANPAVADGVTVYFDDYPKDGGSEKIIKFVKTLRKKLDDLREEYYLNIMVSLSLDKKEEEVYAFKDLQGIILDTENPEEEYIDLFLVFLEEPTTDTKKELRVAIENEFKGIQRRNMLRKIVPVITPHGHEFESPEPFRQLYDDLVYFQDNFAGVGFWPLPMSTDIGADEVKRNVIQVFEKKESQDLLAGVFSKYAPELCEFACPQRWAFRIGFDVLLALFLIYGLFSIWVYKLRVLYKKYTWYFLGGAIVTISIFFISLVCDPYLKSKASGILILFVITAISYTLWRYVRKMKQGELP